MLAIVIAQMPILLSNCGPVGPPDGEFYTFAIRRNLPYAGPVWPILQSYVTPETPVNIRAVADIKDIVDIGSIDAMLDRWTSELVKGVKSIADIEGTFDKWAKDINKGIENIEYADAIEGIFDKLPSDIVKDIKDIINIGDIGNIRDLFDIGDIVDTKDVENIFDKWKKNIIKDIKDIDFPDINLGKQTETGGNILSDLSSALEANDFVFHRWAVSSGKAKFGDANRAKTTVTLSSNAIIRADFVIRPERQFNPNVTYSSFTDSRDGQSYRTVVIGGKRWMAQNLNYTKSGSWCYNSNSSNCITFGRLYNWDAAMSACPAGWHLPANKEWNDLIRAVSDDGNGRGAAAKLKSRAGWNFPFDLGMVFKFGNGTDDYGFSALPGGRWESYIPGIDILTEMGYVGNWWSSTESSSWHSNYVNIFCLGKDVGGSSLLKIEGASVRCVQDD